MLSVIGESNSQKEMLKALRACYTMYEYVLKSREYLQAKSSLLLRKGTTKEAPSSIETILSLLNKSIYKQLNKSA